MSAARVSEAHCQTTFVPIASFARIKPLDADNSAGPEAAKQIVAWDFGPPGTVTMSEDAVSRVASSGSRKSGKVFDHLAATLPPEATQASVYDTIAAPLVRRFLAGNDVDLLCYGQTGSGKTFTMFGPPQSMARAAAKVGESAEDTVTGEGILQPEHGFILRSGLEALAFVDEVERRCSGARAVLHGSMVELSIFSLTDQSVSDLLNDMAPCYVDEQHHLQGAKQVELRCAADLVRMAAAVEKRSVRGTKMNDTSSRSHCVTVLTLLHLDEAGSVRCSRLQFFDLMGSERFVGANAAHDASKSSKATMGGWEGIYANLSLSALMSAVDIAAQARRSKKKAVVDSAMTGFLLTKLLMGSLTGGALTGMITCISQAPRNGEETFLSLKFGAGMAALLNKPTLPPALPHAQMLRSVRAQLEASAAVMAKGVKGKYQARREAEVAQREHDLRVLLAVQPAAECPSFPASLSPSLHLLFLSLARNLPLSPASVSAKLVAACERHPHSLPRLPESAHLRDQGLCAGRRLTLFVLTAVRVISSAVPMLAATQARCPPAAPPPAALAARRAMSQPSNALLYGWRSVCCKES